MYENLVPVFIDKNTGKKVATTAVTLRSIGIGHSYIQSQAGVVWDITHNENTKNVICQIFDEQYQAITANEIIVVDNNTIQVQFGADQTGFAHLMFFQ